MEIAFIFHFMLYIFNDNLFIIKYYYFINLSLNLK